jgi:hypothetical protein
VVCLLRAPPHARKRWQLYYFYGGLGAHAGVASHGFRSRVPFAQKRAALAAWAQAEPRSTAARIGMAQLYLRANYLQPKWLGAPGELAEYVRGLLQVPGGDDRKIAQSYAADVLGRNIRRSELVETTGLSWPAVREGYLLREARRGLRSRAWNALLNVAAAAGDRATAQRALSAIGEDWSPLVWRSGWRRKSSACMRCCENSR